MPGFRPFSIASPTRLAAPLTASDTSSIVDFDAGTGSRPSHTNGGGGMSSAMGKLSGSAGGNRSDRSSFLSGTITFEALSSRIHSEDLDRVRAALQPRVICWALTKQTSVSCTMTKSVGYPHGARRRSRYRRPDYVWRVHRCNRKKEGRRGPRNACWRNEPSSEEFFCDHFSTDNNICPFNDDKRRNGE